MKTTDLSNLNEQLEDPNEFLRLQMNRSGFSLKVEPSGCHEK